MGRSNLQAMFEDEPRFRERVVKLAAWFHPEDTERWLEEEPNGVWNERCDPLGCPHVESLFQLIGRSLESASGGDVEAHWSAESFFESAAAVASNRKEAEGGEAGEVRAADPNRDGA